MQDSEMAKHIQQQEISLRRLTPFIWQNSPASPESSYKTFGRSCSFLDFNERHM